jgi:hypothetical protein
MKTFIIATILVLSIPVDLYSQETKLTSIGFGASSAIPFQMAYSDFPSISSSPLLNIKFRRHEILTGVDFYFLGPKYNKELYPLVIGGQGEYRYHFLRPDKRHNFFVNTNLQYVQFQNGCGIYAKPYNFGDKYICNDGNEYKNKTLINTYGVGIEYHFQKRLFIYSSCGFGYYYSIVKDLYDHPLGNRANWTVILRAGLSFSLFQKTKEPKCGL